MMGQKRSVVVSRCACGKYLSKELSEVDETKLCTTCYFLYHIAWGRGFEAGITFAIKEAQTEEPE